MEVIDREADTALVAKETGHSVKTLQLLTAEQVAEWAGALRVINRCRTNRQRATWARVTFPALLALAMLGCVAWGGWRCALIACAVSIVGYVEGRLVERGMKP